ncbi:MAG: dihydroorotase [Prevotella sp.]|nr:dihydroorotase [Prevotella sp.]
MRTIIEGGTIVNEEHTFRGSIVIDDEYISEIIEGSKPIEGTFDSRINAAGCFVLPGVIDSHVHFREPGLTEKADISTESLAAAAGGVTTYFDMPNTVPQTTTLEALEAKHAIARKKSHVNYSFFLGATNDNAELLAQVNVHSVPGIKLFMGSSTGNMLVDRDEALNRIFSTVGSKMPIMAHCEDTDIINRNMEAFREQYGDDPDVRLHPLIRSEEACLSSTMKAIMLAVTNKARLHIAHISTAAELEMIPANCIHTLTAEATVGHLLFSLTDYSQLGTRIKVNPAIKNFSDCNALRQGLTDGRITTVSTDHAPHLLSQKEGGCAKAASGMPMIQFSLVSMLGLVDEGVLTIDRLVRLMSHNPAELFEVKGRGFLRTGYKADITIVRPDSPWEVTTDCIVSRCGWSPVEGRTFRWRVEQTLCNGHSVYANGQLDHNYIGQAVTFR